MSNIHSTGRGGAGNIGEDNSTYIDGSIVREGVAGESSRPEYSAGRGGAGNIIDSPRSRSPAVASQEVVPEPSMRSAEGYENYHTGRGGGGNVHKDKHGGHSHAPGESVGDKLKAALGLDKKKKESEADSALKNEVK